MAGADQDATCHVPCQYLAPLATDADETTTLRYICQCPDLDSQLDLGLQLQGRCSRRQNLLGQLGFDRTEHDADAGIVGQVQLFASEAMLTPIG